MKRYLIASVSALALALMLATPAAASGPVRAPAPAPPSFDLPAEICGFVVHVDVLVNNEYSLTWSDEQGTPVRQIVTGNLVVQLTNTTNDASVTLNIPGPGTYVFHADGSNTLYAGGPWVFFFAPGQLGPGSEPGITLFHGRSVLWTAANGFDQQLIHHGAATDVCPMIA